MITAEQATADIKGTYADGSPWSIKKGWKRRHRTRGVTVERLPKMVNVDPATGCWIWKGKKRTAGGHANVFYEGVHTMAHRVAWTLLRGPIPDGMKVLHNCPCGDNPACVNPDHLFLGTTADNQTDMVRKGRSLRGEKNCKAKLTENQVIEIRRLHRSGVSIKELSRRFGTRSTSMSKTVRGIFWRHVPMEAVAC